VEAVKKKTREREEADRKQSILSEFKEKRGSYPAYWDPIYSESEKHLNFTLLGKQFQDGEANKYGLVNPLEPNLLLTYANHEANKTLQTDYRTKITPNGGNADDVKATARQDVIRGLNRRNNIEQVFNQVRRNQVCGGIAYSIARVEYAGKRGYGKTLTDEFLSHWKNVYPDPYVKTVTFSDARDFLIKQDVPKSEWLEVTGRNPDDENWHGAKTKEVWHFWRREESKDEEILLTDGKTRMKSGMKEEDWKAVKYDDAEQPLSRPTSDYTWCWYKIVDEEIIDSEDWLGSYPPLVACTGRKVVDGDKVYYQPLTQFAEEPQKVFTIIENIMALRLSRSPYSKWKVAFESLNVANIKELRDASVIGNMDVVYNHRDTNGNEIPIPEEIEPHILDPILITLQNEQRMKIQQIFGIFDANLGNKSNEQSGVAIEARARGGELSNFDSQFNYMEYVEQVGRVKLDLIPHYLNAQQQVAFVSEDDTSVVRWINTTGGVSFSPDEEYSLSVEAMPISQTAREEEAASLTNIFKIAPNLAQNPLALAELLKVQPGRGGAKIADILVKGDPRLQQSQQMVQQLQGQLQQAAQKDQAQTMALQAMKQSMGLLKQQMTLIKQSADLQAQEGEAKKGLEDMLAQADAMDKALDRQIEQYKAESGRITADAAMIKVMGDLAKPDPQTPAPGEAMP
jgi:hypothetical protein